MAYSYFDYEGTDTTIQTDILCVSTEHMYAFKVLSEDESNVTLSDVALAATFTKNNAGVLCELNTAPSTKIRVIRSTPYDVLMHDFSNGAQFNAFSVDEVYEQVLYLCQELVEGKLIIDSSGNFGGTRAGISSKELQEQLAAQYSMGYSVGSTHQYKALEEMINKVAVGLQNKSDNGHTHRAAEISDFAEAVATLTVRQKIGTFDICKLPDGTQIQSGTVRIQNHNNNQTARVLTWPLAFVDAPVVVATMSAPEGNVRDALVTIDNRQSNQSAVHYWLYESAYPTPDVTVNFVAIGRWK